jgi:hypothetical protein
MPTIKIRKQADGATRYTAIVRLRSQGKVLHRESRTFTHRSAALSWAKHREVALENPAELTRLRLSTPSSPRSACVTRTKLKYHLIFVQGPRPLP